MTPDKRTLAQSETDPAIEAFKLLCRNIGTDYSLRALKLAEEAKWKDLIDLDIKPREYHSARAFHQDYAVYAYLRKYKGFKAFTQKELEEKCLVDFEKIDDACFVVNERIQKSLLSRGVEGVLMHARRKIAALLGPFEIDKVMRHCEWGNGATESLKLRDATVDKKILEPRLSVTPSCHKYAFSYLMYDLHWLRARLGPDVLGPVSLLRSNFRFVESGRFSTVDKTAKARRSIDIQPTLNLFFQKGVGRFIRRRLQRDGIDLDDQSRNQELAGQAIGLNLATIDLANASDTVSRKLVELLLPYEWFEYLNDIRTHSIRLPGHRVRKLEKFSSMGNGFTFELESLIFYALCIGVKKEVEDHEAIVSVYGDDIIVSNSLTPLLLETLNEIGFSVNVDKTFTEGQFYESCGVHFFGNEEVTPVYQKEKVDSKHPITSIRAANRIIRISTLLGSGEWLDARCKDSYDLYRSLARTHLKKEANIDGPLWLEGDGFIKYPYFRPKADRNGIFYINEFRTVSRKRKLRDGSPLLAITLRRGVVVKSPFNGFVDIRSETRTLLTRRRCYLRLSEVPVWASPVVKPG